MRHLKAVRPRRPADPGNPAGPPSRRGAPSDEGPSRPRRTKRTVRNAASGQRRSAPGAARTKRPGAAEGERPKVDPAVFVATKNAGKARELAELLEGVHVRVTGPARMPRIEAPVEDGKTFRANAVKKALHYSRKVKELVLADDSGLEIDALDGAPGIRSARLGGPAATDADKLRLILGKMAHVAWEDRTARFRCVIAFAQKGEILATFQGEVEGRIAFEPEGAEGFGYDPIFYHDPSDKTFAEMKPDDKHRVSHRGQALERAALWIRERFPAEGKADRPRPSRDRPPVRR